MRCFETYCCISNPSQGIWWFEDEYMTELFNHYLIIFINCINILAFQCLSLLIFLKSLLNAH